MALLPVFQTDVKDLVMLQNRWVSELNPILANPSNNASILKNVKLIVGSNTINHLLGKTLTGWVIVRQRGPASIYDTQDTNQMPALTLQLTSDAVVTVDIQVM